MFMNPDPTISVLELLRDGGAFNQLMNALAICSAGYVVFTAIWRRFPPGEVPRRLVALSFLPMILASLLAQHWFLTIRALV